MTPLQFAGLARFLKERSGLSIGESKRYLVEARLASIARTRGLASLGDLVDLLTSGRDLALAQGVIEAMTTNETYFFRDGAPFTRFVEVALPRLLKARAGERRLRIWSAACSSGQEPYSLAMLLAERASLLAGWKVEIVATDLSGEIVDRAKAGLFSQFEVQRGLPIRLLLKHFVQEGERWRIEAALRERIQFRTLNLLRDFSALGRFDVVFCRNVLIYFDEATKADVIDRIARQTAEDGFVFLGAAEATMGLPVQFQAHADRPAGVARHEQAPRPLALVGAAGR